MPCLSTQKVGRSVGNTAATDSELGRLLAFCKKRHSRGEGEDRPNRAAAKKENMSGLVDGFSGGEYVLRRVQLNVARLPESNVKIIPI